jgi:sigma-E factor negative regulatory protein RseA
MEKISELMDGELDSRECRVQIQRLEHDPALTGHWETYHLIRDALRNEVDLGPQFSRKVHERLAGEPVIIAPHTRASHRVARYALPMAAGLAGIAVVGWLALSSGTMSGGSVQTVAQHAAPAAAVAPLAKSTAPAAQPMDGQVRDYMLAHQEFSPSTAMQGVASYVRTVSTDDTPGAQ